jgi:hypothetical protein
LPNSSTDGDKLHAELQVGSAVVVFTKMTWGDQLDTNKNPTGATFIKLEFEPGAKRDAVQAIAVALGDATADTSVRLTVRGLAPLGAADVDPIPQASGSIGLDTASTSPLRAGPPALSSSTFRTFRLDSAGCRSQPSRLPSATQSMIASSAVRRRMTGPASTTTHTFSPSTAQNMT